MKRSVLFALASCATLAFVAPATASAATYESRGERVVSFGDLDLDNQVGAEALRSRIRHAARVVCGDRPGRTPLWESQYVRRCMREATEQAVADVNNTNVTDLYYSRRPRVTIVASR